MGKFQKPHLSDSTKVIGLTDHSLKVSCIDAEDLQFTKMLTPIDICCIGRNVMTASMLTIL